MSARPSCPRCSEAVYPGSRFCPQCGFDISAEQGLVTTATDEAVIDEAVEAESDMLDELQSSLAGDYEFLGELGRGGMAIVYLANDLRLDRKVAIKIMSPALFHSSGSAQRFKREARASAALSHPHIVPMHAVSQAGRIFYLVMKFVPGRALDSVMRETGPMPVKMVSTILYQVGTALGYAHRNGVIHRDVKPSNVMIDDEGFAMVMDFGVAKWTQGEDITSSGTIIGTPAYMSPEQCSGLPLSGVSDQYSLGVVAYEMLSGVQPFRGDSLMEVMKRHFFDEPEPIDQLRPDCSSDLCDVVTRMLRKKPEDRFETLEQVISRLPESSLVPDDPIRMQMIALAKRGSGMQRVAELSTPRSPVLVVPKTEVSVDPPAGISERADPAAPKVTVHRWLRQVFKYSTTLSVLAVVVIGAMLVDWRNLMFFPNGSTGDNAASFADSNKMLEATLDSTATGTDATPSLSGPTSQSGRDTPPPATQETTEASAQRGQAETDRPSLPVTPAQLPRDPVEQQVPSGNDQRNETDSSRTQQLSGNQDGTAPDSAARQTGDVVGGGADDSVVVRDTARVSQQVRALVRLLITPNAVIHINGERVVEEATREWSDSLVVGETYQFRFEGTGLVPRDTTMTVGPGGNDLRVRLRRSGA